MTEDNVRSRLKAAAPPPVKDVDTAALLSQVKTRRRNRHAAVALAGLSLLGVSIATVVAANTPPSGVDVATDPTTTQPVPTELPSQSGSSQPSIPAIAGDDLVNHRADVSEAQADIARAFVQFALDPSRDTARRVPFAQSGVQIGFEGSTFRRIPFDQLDAVQQWEIDNRVGSTSPLAVVSRYSELMSGTPRLWASSRSVPLCIGGSQPNDITTDDVVHITPNDIADDGCAQQFRLDVVLTSQDTVSTIALVVEEP